MKQEMYICRIKCKNCNYGYPNEDDMAIPKGIREKEWSNQTECPRCGCKGTLYFYGGYYGEDKKLDIEEMIRVRSTSPIVDKQD